MLVLCFNKLANVTYYKTLLTYVGKLSYKQPPCLHFQVRSKHVHFLFTTGLVILNPHSLDVDIAGNAKYFLTILDKAGYLPSFLFYHTSKS